MGEIAGRFDIRMMAARIRGALKGREDALPHSFMEFDILDQQTGRFPDTPARRAITGTLPVCSAAVLAEGTFERMATDSRRYGALRLGRQGGLFQQFRTLPGRFEGRAWNGDACDARGF